LTGGHTRHLFAAAAPSAEMPSRRRTLALLSGSVVGAVAGCLDGDSGTAPGKSGTTDPRDGATTEAGGTAPSTAEPTVPPTDQPEASTERPTRTCAEQPITPDLTVENERAAARTVHVRLVEAPDDAARVLFEREYTVDAGERLTETERIYGEADAGAYSDDFLARTDAGRGRTDASTVARNPTLYGVTVALREGGPELWEYHADPGERYNPNCYP